MVASGSAAGGVCGLRDDEKMLVMDGTKTTNETLEHLGLLCLPPSQSERDHYLRILA